MKKKLILSIFIVLLLAFSLQTAFADDTTATAIRLDGVTLSLSAIVKDDNLYLPVRAIGEALGYEVSWSQPDKTVMLTANGRKIILNLKESKINADGHESYLQNTYEVLKGRNYLSDMFYSDNLALKVQWDKANHVVTLSSVRENAIAIGTGKIASESKALITDIQYPVIGGMEDKAIQAVLNAVFKKQANLAAAEGRKNAADLAPYVLKNPDMPGQCGTYFDYRVAYNQNGFLSLVFQDYQYAGGAHGTTVQTSFTIPLKTGQPMALKDLFTTGADYQAIVNNGVKTQLNERDLTAALFEPFSGIGENRSFYLSNDGVVVYFQQYEILPYVAGIQEFTTSYTSIEGLLKEQILLEENMDEDKAATVLLSAIRDSAGFGRVINCPYPVETTVIEGVIKDWGIPSLSMDIPAAKGTYVSFHSHKVVFGFNKGSQIFEVRSLDGRLPAITLGKAMDILGFPMFTATSNQQQILGYMAGTAYELVLYFAENTVHPEAAVLEHYEVLYPRGTVNLMADDPGRDWSVLNTGDSFSVNLKGNPTTGYSWYFTVSDANVVKTVSENSVPDSEMMGAGSTFIWNFTAGTAGNAAITLKYYRIWEGESSTLPDNIRTFNMSVR